MNNYIVYMHTSPSGKRYIGLTCRKPSLRWGLKGQNYKTNKHFANAIKCYGWDAFEHVVLFDGLSKEQASEIERDMIAVFKTDNPKFGYNQTTGGEIGFDFTDEVKKKMSHPKKLTDEQRKKLVERARELGKKSKGRKMPQESIKKMAEAKRGKKQTKEAVAKRTEALKKAFALRKLNGGMPQEQRDSISKRFKGIKRSEAFCMKMKEAKSTEKNARSKKVRQMLDDGTIVKEYLSAREAERQTGISYTSIVRVCNKVRLKHAGGFKWEYCKQ